MKKNYNDERWLALASAVANLKQGALVDSGDDHVYGMVTVRACTAFFDVASLLSEAQPTVFASVLGYIIYAGLDALSEEWNLNDADERKRLTRVIENKYKGSLDESIH